KKQNPDRVTLLVGNHELHYYNRRYACGRFDGSYYEKYREVLTGEETAGLFQICKQTGKYLFIHAGLTKDWYDAHVAEFSKLGNTLEEQLNGLLHTGLAVFDEASSYYRGGFHRAGSPLWADAAELADEPEHFDTSTVQIVGHTQLQTDVPYIGENFRLLDNRQLYLLKDDEIIKYVQ
ncbi:MAG: hypothetical protein LBQ01_05355, partial [Prevotellaceae bacterium]|nr:hypothetical protein [Prevotellaceae bacterium]